MISTKILFRVVASTLMSLALFTSLILSPLVRADGVSISIASSEVAVSATGDITLSYTSTAAVSTSDNISLTLDTAYTGTPTFTINTEAATSTNSTSGSSITYTLTPASVVSAGAVSIVISGLTAPSTAGNYGFTILTSTGDYGSVLQYVGDANDVSVTAQILPILTFVIRNDTDTANTNTCDLGTLLTVQAATCAYRLKVFTNAANGYTVSMSASGDLASTDHNFSNAAAGNGGTGGDDISNATAGTEKYGAVITPGATTSGSVINLANSYDAGSNAVAYNNTSAANLITSAGPNSPATTGDTANTSLVTHKANISAASPSGFYTQTVTYTVVASF
ncbi:MAG: hypothetical protein AAGF07_03555 [Patescibacteria group bacterium]